MNWDYETLRLLAWLLLWLAISGFALFDGVGLGAALGLPLLAQSVDERHTLLARLSGLGFFQHSWLLALFALGMGCWPLVVAVLLSSLYKLLWPLLFMAALLPLALGLRPSCLAWPRLLSRLDQIIGLGSAVLVAGFGLVLGNIIKGIPFHFDSDMRILFLGNVTECFNPFALLVAAVTLSMLVFYGASFQQLHLSHADTDLAQRNQRLLLKAGVAYCLLFGLAGLWISHLEGYHVTTELLTNAPSNPLSKFVKRGEGLWLDNYEHQPSVWLLPALALVSALASLVLSHYRRLCEAFAASAISVLMTVLTAGVSLFPFLLPSNRSLNSALTIWDASASMATLQLLVPVALLALPLLALLTRWLYARPEAV
jgi:cytochrome d ubiquinol oxidase subunit II